MLYQSSFGPVYFSVTGPEKAPVVVFTPGITMDHRSFDAQVEALKGNYRALVWDLPGHGKSFELNQPFRYSLAAGCLKGVLGAIDAKDVTLVGVSLGGQINQYYAYHNPERVMTLVEVGSLALHRRFGSLVRFMGRLYVASSRLIPERMVYSWFAKSRALKPKTQDYLREQAEIMGKDKIMRITSEMFKDMAEGIPGPVTQPLFIIHGDKEMAFLRKHLSNWHKQTPGSRYAVITNAGHLAHQDNPDAFNEVLIRYLDQRMKFRE